MRMRTVLAALALTAVTVSGCSDAGDGAGENADSVGAAGTETTEAEKDLDTGDYDTTFYAPLGEITDPESGEIVESTEILKNLLLPSEVNKDFDEVVWHILESTSSLERVESKALNDHAQQFQSGVNHRSRSTEDNRQFDVVVYRFDSPETAGEVQAAYADEIRTEDDYYGPFTDRPVEALQDTVALENHPEPIEPGSSIHAELQSKTLSTHNEFLIETTLSAPEEISDEDIDFVSEYLRAQAPLLDAVPTHRTEAGFGRLDNWAELDPDDVVRYALHPVRGSDESQYYPANMNARTFAMEIGLNYVKTKDAFRAFDVESVGSWLTNVVRTKDEAGAEKLRDFLDEENSVNEPTSYEEPQAVPGTTCSEYIDASAKKTYSCVMVHGRYVAHSSIDEYPESNGETAVNRDDAAADGKVDAKTRLSQRMAAQYELFEDAEANPEGSPREAPTAVNKRGESTVETTPADGGSGSSEPAEPAETPVNREEASESQEESVINVN